MELFDFKDALREAITAGDNIGVCIRVGYQNKFLLLKRSLTDSEPGIYEMPGGSVESGESLEAAVQRELLEEAGITVIATDLRPLGIFQFQNAETGKRKTKFAFSILLDEKPNIELSLDHSDYVFLSVEEIDELPRQGRDSSFVLWKDHFEMLATSV